MEKTYSPELIEKLFSSDGCKWDESGTKFQTLNPLRDDKNLGSFFINNKGFFKDFASGDSGHITKLLMEMNGYEYVDALKELGEYDPNYNSHKYDHIERYDKWFDLDGNPLHICLNRDRTRKPGNQTWWTYSDDFGETWKLGKNGKKTSLYNLQKVLKSDQIIIVEGEGCVESLEKFLGKNSEFAVTTSGSATSWTNNVSKLAVQILKDKKIFILPDNDEPGEQYALKIYRILKKFQIDCYIVDLPGLKEIEIEKKREKCKTSQDIKDWIKAGNNLDLFLITLEESENRKPVSVEDIVNKTTTKLSWYEFYKEYSTLDKITAIQKVFTHIFEKRFNTVLNQSEYRDIGSTDWIILDDREFESLWVYLTPKLEPVCGYISKEQLVGVLNQKTDNDYDPFINWTEKFNSYQLRSMLDKFFSLIELEDNNRKEIFKTVLTKWMVATYSLLAGKTTKNEICPVISGGQGIGKNRLIEKLFETLDQKYIFTGSIQADNKDSKKRISTMAVIHLDEFDATTKKSEISSLKSLITATEFTDRLPYGRIDITLKRRASLIASINTDVGILVDDTGNRRFPTFRVKSIDLEKLMLIDTFKLWSEIKYLALSGEISCFFTKEELNLIESGNEAFRKIDPFEEYITENYSSEKEGKEILLTSTEIYESIKSDFITKNQTSTKIGRIMNKLGFKQFRSNNVRKFILYEKLYHENGSELEMGS